MAKEREKKDIEERFYKFTPKAEKREDGTAVISGRPIVYSSPTDIGGIFREIIEPGALEGADLRDVPLLVNHNDRMIPVARSRRNNGNSTMTLIPDMEGMAFNANLDIERNATASELYSSVDRGDMDGMSFGFRVAKEMWEGLDTDYPTRHIQKFEIIREISAVTFPAYESTSIYARSKEALESARSAVESARQREGKSLDSDDASLELAKAKYYFRKNY